MELNQKGLSRWLWIALSAALSLGVASAPARAAEPAKVVIQVSDNDVAKWNLALNNAKNIQKDLGKDNVNMAIVAFGPGIGMLKADAEVANRVAEAAESGVKVLACQNTMRNQKLNKEDMHGSIGYVPSGVVELMQRQHQGFAYLRP